MPASRDKNRPSREIYMQMSMKMKFCHFIGAYSRRTKKFKIKTNLYSRYLHLSIDTVPVKLFSLGLTTVLKIINQYAALLKIMWVVITKFVVSKCIIHKQSNKLQMIHHFVIN